MLILEKERYENILNSPLRKLGEKEVLNSMQSERNNKYQSGNQWNIKPKLENQ